MQLLQLYMISLYYSINYIFNLRLQKVAAVAVAVVIKSIPVNYKRTATRLNEMQPDYSISTYSYLALYKLWLHRLQKLQPKYMFS